MWDKLTLDAFERAKTAREPSWYGPWDTVLHLLFKHTDGFEISPALLEQQSHHVPHHVPDRSIYYIVRKAGTPVFFAVIKPHDHLNSIWTRATADQQMRERFADFKEGLQPSRLYGISCMGTQFGFWDMDRDSGDITPQGRERAVSRVTDTAPREWWPYDVLTQSGHKELTSIARHVHDLVKPPRLTPHRPSSHHVTNLPAPTDRGEQERAPAFPQTTAAATAGMWDRLILDAFERAKTAHEPSWYGPWDTVIRFLFKNTDGFVINPAYLEQHSLHAPDRSIYYIVLKAGTPVFFAVIKPHGHLNSIWTRAVADQQMRERFADFKESAQPSRLYGISCMGTQFGFWNMVRDGGDITPKGRERAVSRVIDTAPREWWPYDVLTPSGHKELTSVARHVQDLVKPPRPTHHGPSSHNIADLPATTNRGEPEAPVLLETDEVQEDSEVYVRGEHELSGVREVSHYVYDEAPTSAQEYLTRDG